MLTSPETPGAQPPALQDLSWLAQKSKEDVLTLSLLQAVNQAFAGTGATLAPEHDYERRLRQDFVLTLPTGEQLTVEAKFEDYAASLFAEVAQLVVRRDGARAIERGWIYKTTAQYLLYVSPVSGLATLIPRARALELQVLLLQDLLLESADYDVPVMLNAALNAGARGEAIPMPRAGIGLGLLRQNILRAYQCHYGDVGLFQFDLSSSLSALKSHFLGSHPLENGPALSPSLVKWAQDKLLSEPRQGVPGLVALSDLVGHLCSCPLVRDNQLSCAPIAPNCYKFFVNAAAAQMNSGQVWLFPHVAGRYQVQPGVAVDVKRPLPSKASPVHQGQLLPRARVQHRTPAQLAQLTHVPADLNDRRWAYLDKLNALEPAEPLCA